MEAGEGDTKFELQRGHGEEHDARSYQKLGGGFITGSENKYLDCCGPGQIQNSNSKRSSSTTNFLYFLRPKINAYLALRGVKHFKI